MNKAIKTVEQIKRLFLEVAEAIKYCISLC